MSSDVTYQPPCHCVACIQGFTLTAATVTVQVEGRTYQACSLHAPVLEQSPTLADALRMVKKHNKNQGGAA